MRAFFPALLFSLALAPAAFAGDAKVAFHDGRADVVAHDAPLSEVLAEWARVGGVSIVNGERVPGGRVTIELRDVPEATALDVLLRSASGFIAVPRDASTSGVSRFARILILPSSTAPAAMTAAASRQSGAPVPSPVFQTFPAAGAPRMLPSGATPVLGADGRPVPDDQDDEVPPPGVAPPPVQSMPPGYGPPPTFLPLARPMLPTSSPVPGSAVPGVVIQPGAIPGQVMPGQVPQPPKKPQA